MPERHVPPGLACTALGVTLPRVHTSQNRGISQEKQAWIHSSQEPTPHSGSYTGQPALREQLPHTPDPGPLHPGPHTPDPGAPHPGPQSARPG